jgi:hypothetical protein
MSGLEYKVPTFAPGPVRKEIMQCLRDIALDAQDIRYFEYTNGVIAGCALVEKDMKIGLVNGMVKFANRIYKLKEKIFVPYEPTDALTILKLRFSPQITNTEYTHYTADLVLDTDTTLKPHEMEMGRFKLKRGSRLRATYTNFWDMATEYDTVNLIHVLQSARVNPTLSPAITRHFAQEAYKFLADNPLDSAFCTHALAGGEPLSRELIERYVCNRLKKDYETMNNAQLHASLGKVLDLITGRSGVDKGLGHDDGIILIN